VPRIQQTTDFSILLLIPTNSVKALKKLNNKTTVNINKYTITRVPKSVLKVEPGGFLGVLFCLLLVFGR